MLLSHHLALPHCTISILGIGNQDALLDRGAVVNILSTALVPAGLVPTSQSVHLFTVSGGSVDSVRTMVIPVTALQRTSLVNLVVVSKPIVSHDF